MRCQLPALVVQQFQRPAHIANARLGFRRIAPIPKRDQNGMNLLADEARGVGDVAINLCDRRRIGGHPRT
jgi:hypothetical protein